MNNGLDVVLMTQMRKQLITRPIQGYPFCPPGRMFLPHPRRERLVLRLWRRRTQILRAIGVPAFVSASLQSSIDILSFE